LTALEELMADEERKAVSRFFLRIGQAGKGRWRDEATLPLFSLPLILDAEGMLAREARHLVSDEAEYLRRCRSLIESVSLELA